MTGIAGEGGHSSAGRAAAARRPVTRAFSLAGGDGGTSTGVSGSEDHNEAAGHDGSPVINVDTTLEREQVRGSGEEEHDGAPGSSDGGNEEAEMQLVQPVLWASVAARIRAYYNLLPECSNATRVVDPRYSDRRSRFCSPALRHALQFSLSAGGCGFSNVDNVAFAGFLRSIEGAATRGTDHVGEFTNAFSSDYSFLTATKAEQSRVLAMRQWMEVHIEIGDRTFTFFFRDILDAGLDSLRHATSVSFGEDDPPVSDAVIRAVGRPEVVQQPVAGDAMQADDKDDSEMDDGLPPISAEDDDGEGRKRRGTLDSEMYRSEMAEVHRLHGRDAKVMAVQLHADEALVSWSGAHHIFPVRVKYVNVLDGGGRWVTVGYIQHIPKAVTQTAVGRLAVSDLRNDLLQRCLAMTLKKLLIASETGVSSDVASYGTVRLFPRITGLVMDQVEERSVLALMGNQANFYCTQCLVSRAAARGGQREDQWPRRDVITTLEAQLTAAAVRLEDPRASRRRHLAETHSARAFVPVLGAMHGLSTGNHYLYDAVAFDLLHVWKLGVLCNLAQTVPSFLRAVCATGAAVEGPVTMTLDAINMRGFHLGRLCRSTPASPG